MSNVNSPSPHLSDYEVARLKRIQFIQNEIKRIGVLKKMQTSQTEMRRQLSKPKKKLNYARKARKRVSSRASPRLAGKKWSTRKLNSFGMHHQIRDKNGNKVSIRRVKKKLFSKNVNTYDTERKEKLESMKGTIDKFESFLIGLGDSSKIDAKYYGRRENYCLGKVLNIRNDAFFRRNEPVHLGCNFRDLISDAWDFENTW